MARSTKGRGRNPRISLHYELVDWVLKEGEAAGIDGDLARSTEWILRRCMAQSQNATPEPEVVSLRASDDLIDDIASSLI